MKDYKREIKELVNDEFQGYEYKYIGSNADISNLVDGVTWSINKGNEKLYVHAFYQYDKKEVWLIVSSKRGIKPIQDWEAFDSKCKIYLDKYGDLYKFDRNTRKMKLIRDVCKWKVKRS